MAGLFSTGRSGSTMLGALLDAHPLVAYRFEPIHRLPNIERRQFDAFQRFNDPHEWARDLFDRLSPGASLVDKPPFFAKTSRSYLGMRTLYPLARVFPPADAI